METSRDLNVLLDHNEGSIPAKKITQYDRASLLLLRSSPLALMRPNLPYDGGFVIGVDSFVKPRKSSVIKSTPHLTGGDTGFVRFVRGLRPLLQYHHTNPPVAVDSLGLPMRYPAVQQKPAREIEDPKTMKSINSEIYVEGASVNRLPPRLQDVKARQAPQPPSVTDTSAMDVVAAVSPNQQRKDKKMNVVQPTNEHIIAEYKRAKNLSLMTGVAMNASYQHETKEQGLMTGAAVSASYLHSEKTKEQGSMTGAAVNASCLHSEKTKEQGSDGNAVIGNADVCIQDLEATVQIIINKLRPANVDTLAKEIRELPISNIDHLERVVDMIFVKAVEEPSLSQACARMCKVLTGMPILAGTAEGQELVNVRAFLVNRCQAEFAKHKALSLSRELIMEEVGQVQDGKLRSDYMAVYLTLERNVQSTFFRSIGFYGVLFNAQLLSTSLMHLYITHLLSLGYRESLECLCSLLTAIGKTLESKSGLLGNANDLTEVFTRLTVLMNECEGVSPALHRVLQDVIILRNRNWVPRNDPPNSNTMVPLLDPTIKTPANTVELKPKTHLGTFLLAVNDSAKAGELRKDKDKVEHKDIRARSLAISSCAILNKTVQPNAPPEGPQGIRKGKQDPEHHGEPAGTGSSQIKSVGVTNQSRPAGSQPFYTSPLDPVPRMPSHRGITVDMFTNRVGQQMVSHPTDPFSVDLGPGAQFSKWTRGNATKTVEKEGEKETAQGSDSNALKHHTTTTGAAKIHPVASSVLPSLPAPVKSTPTPLRTLTSASGGAIPKTVQTGGVGSVVPQQPAKAKILMPYATGSASGRALPKTVRTGGVGSMVPHQSAMGKILTAGHAERDLFRTTQLAMEVARQRAQAEHDERAKVAAEKQKVREAVKLQERLAKYSYISIGHQLNAANETGQGDATKNSGDQQLAMEVARQRAQAEYDERAKVAAEKLNEREAVKLQERLAKHSEVSIGHQLNAATTTGQGGATMNPGVASNENALFENLYTLAKEAVTGRRVNVASDKKHSKRPKMSSEFNLENLQILLEELLPKLSTDDISGLISEIQALPINSNQTMKQAFNVIFDMAVGEVGSLAREALAEAVRTLTEFPLPAQSEHGENVFDYRLQLRILVANRCNDCLERNLKHELERDDKLKEVNLQSDMTAKTRLYQQCLEEERVIRLKFIGFVEFCLMLFQRQLLSAKMLHRCIRHLFSSGDDVSLTSLCQLLFDMGKGLDDAAKPGTIAANQLTEYFNRLKEIAGDPKRRDAASPLVPMILDLLRLRDAKWLRA